MVITDNLAEQRRFAVPSYFSANCRENRVLSRQQRETSAMTPFVSLASALWKGPAAMSAPLNRQELFSLVQTLMQGKGNKREMRKLIDRSVPCPSGYVFDLVFYPDRHDLGSNPTAEEIVDKALSYKPIQL